MTISTLLPPVSYAEDGVTTQFSVPFRFFHATDLKVTRVLADGTRVALAYGSDWTVSGADSPSGGTLTRTAATNGATVIIDRDTSIDQQTHYSNGDAFPASSHERALDKLTAIAQEVRALLDRTMRFPAGEGSFELAYAAARAGMYLAFDGDGLPIASSGTGADAGLRADLAAYGGSQLIGTRRTGSTVTRSLHSKLENYIDVTDFGATGDGSTDDSNAIMAAISHAASLSILIDGFRSVMPVLYFPAGRYKITVVNALAAAFTAARYSGITFRGDGREQTFLIYSAASNASDNYLANFENCRCVTLEDMTVRSTRYQLRGILWGPNGGGEGQGTSWTCDAAIFDGQWTEVFAVQGTALGSETNWIDVGGGAGHASGVFFTIKSTNVQSVNHTFNGCTIGGLGTVFKIRAGGLIRWIAGFSSLFEGATFLDIDGPGEKIGPNSQFIFLGGGVETAFGVASAKLLINNSPANIHFKNYAMGSLNPTGSDPIVVMGHADYQRGGYLTFDHCSYANKKAVFSGGVQVRYIGCNGMSDWQSFMTLNPATNSAYLTPWVEIKGSPVEGPAAPLAPVDCCPGLFLNDYAAKNIPGVQYRGVQPKYWQARASTGGLDAGLITGFNDAFQGFSVKLPLGTILRRVRFYWCGIGNPSVIADREFYSDNYDGSVLFFSNLTIPSAASSSVKCYESDWIGYPVETEAQRVVRFYGRTAYGSAAPSTTDFGWWELEYI